MKHFTLRDLFWLVLVVSVAVGGYCWGHVHGRAWVVDQMNHRLRTLDATREPPKE